jgi:hypothetical protein
MIAIVVPGKQRVGARRACKHSSGFSPLALINQKPSSRRMYFVKRAFCRPFRADPIKIPPRLKPGLLCPLGQSGTGCVHRQLASLRTSLRDGLFMLPRHFMPGYYQPANQEQKPFAHRRPPRKLALMGLCSHGPHICLKSIREPAVTAGMAINNSRQPLPPTRLV